jgi:ribosomal protein L35
MKTHKAIQSRFKVSRSGKLMRRKKGRRHMLTKKSGSKKRHLAKPLALLEPIATKYARLIGAVK